MWLVGVLGLIALLVGFLLLRPRLPRDSDVGLRMTAARGVVFLEWNPQSPVVAQSTGGQLDVEDGENPRLAIQLRPEDLRAGRVSFVPHSSQLHARLRLFDRNQSPQDFVANFIAPEVPAAVQPSPAAPATETPAPADAPAAAVNHSSEPLPVKASESVPLPAPAAPKPAAKPFTAPRTPKKEASSPVMAAPPPIAVAQSLPSAPLAGTPTPAAAAPPPPPKQEKPAVRAPSAGRAIWTGELRAGETLAFEDGHVSKGAITGRWPQRAARMRAAIGELGEGSLAIYSSDPAYRDRAGAFESPSARNGWNLTTYKWDPKISRDLQTIESPGDENQWRRLVVRAGSRKLTLIVLDWEELPQTTGK